MNLKIMQGKDNKWNIINTDTNNVVTGHFTTAKLALDAMKNYKPDPVTEKAKPVSTSRKDQIRHARAKKQGISYSNYISKYCQ